FVERGLHFCLWFAESLRELLDRGRLVGGVDDGFERSLALVRVHRADRLRRSRLSAVCTSLVLGMGLGLGLRLLPGVGSHPIRGFRSGFGLRVVIVELLGIVVHYLYSSSIWRSPPVSSNTSSKDFPFLRTISPNCFS